MSSMRRSVLAVLLLLSVPAWAEEPPRAAREGAAAAAEASNRFGLDLYARLRRRQGNLFLSPYSVSAAMAMTREGAAGATAAQMDAVLHLVGVETGTGHAALAEALEPGQVPEEHGSDARVPAYTIHVAGALWGQEGLALEAPFLARLADHYGAKVERVDFRDTFAARERINAWVSEQTRRKIENIIPPDLPTPDTLLALANAIYFKAQWETPFEERWTREATFHATGGREVPVPMMHRAETFGYAETDDVQILELDYRGREASMVVILPRAADGLPALEADLDAERLAAWLDAIEGREVDVRLPRFRFTTALDLTSTLPAMGMVDAFRAGSADFTRITRQSPLFIGAVLHKAFVAVDENGTEAAAATVVLMLKGAPATPRVEFTADRPFLFLIRHKPTGLILFLGRVVDPKA